VPFVTDDGLAALVAARLCHDLISPLGAIGNGVELLALEGRAAGPELSLVTEAVAQASGRLRLMRLAFGAAGAGQRIGAAEVRAILAGALRGGRLAVAWEVEGEVPRPEVRLALLAILCLEAALPRGGRIVVGAAGGRWRIEAAGPRLRPEAGPFAALSTPEGPGEIAAGTVQFALLHAGAAALGRRIEASLGETAGRIVF
jgi:histidine phosphotransferase ChpT